MASGSRGAGAAAGTSYSQFLKYDRRIKDFSNSKPETVYSVLVAFIKLSFPKGVRKVDIADFGKLVTFGTVNHTYRPLGITAVEYANRIYTDPSYRLISGKFLEEFPLTCSEDHFRTDFPKFIKTFFYDQADTFTDYSDDRTMMVLIIIKDLIVEAVVAKEYRRAAYILTQVQNLQILVTQQPWQYRRVDGFIDKHVVTSEESWYGWADKFDWLVDLQRKLDLIANVNLIDTSILSRPRAPKFSLRTPSTQQMPLYSAAKRWDKKHPHVTKGDLKDPDVLSTESVVTYYISIKLDPALPGDAISTYASHWKLLDYGNRRLGVCLRDYGEAINQSADYQLLEQEMFKAIQADGDTHQTFTDFLRSNLFPTCDPISYDRVMVGILLTSELINRTLSTGGIALAVRFQIWLQDVFHGSPHMIEIIGKGWGTGPLLSCCPSDLSVRQCYHGSRLCAHSDLTRKGLSGASIGLGNYEMQFIRDELVNRDAFDIRATNSSDGAVQGAEHPQHQQTRPYLITAGKKYAAAAAGPSTSGGGPPGMVGKGKGKQKSTTKVGQPTPAKISKLEDEDNEAASFLQTLLDGDS